MNFRRSKKEDLDAIRKIYKENHVDFGGQLVGEFHDSPETKTYIAEISNKVVAYLCISEHLTRRLTTETDLYDKTYLFPQNAIYIVQAAVLKQHQNEGIGKECYQNLQKLYPLAALYAFVHLLNAQSMIFHIRNGFYPIGLYAVPQYNKTLNYTAFLLAKEKKAEKDIVE